MSMLDWAKKEIEIACENTRATCKEDVEREYACSCYESALKAYESLCEDGHSGASIKLTQKFLNRLIDGKALTPIEDTEDVWNDVSNWVSGNSDVKQYQCKRMSSLFKEVYADGTVKYCDVNRIRCEDRSNPNSTYYSSFVAGIVDKLWPITMPYYPSINPIRVICEDLLTDEKNGDFDSLGIISVIKPHSDGRGFEGITINRYFKASGDGWVEITHEEWMERKELHESRLERLALEKWFKKKEMMGARGIERKEDV